MLSLYINSARVGSSRLSYLFNQCGINSHNEPFNRNNKETTVFSFAGDKDTILKYTDIKLKDIKEAYKNYKGLNFYKKIFDAHARSPNFYFLGLQNYSFKGRLLGYFCGTYPCIFTQRRNIDQYISREKAKFFKSYGRTDTTDFKPEADAEEFYKYAMKQSYFYNTCYFSAMNTHKNVTIINYDDWSFESNDNQLSKVRNLLIKRQIKFAKLTSQKINNQNEYKLIKFSFKNNNNSKLEPNNLVRQDKSRSWKNKISNSSEFLNRCKELRIRKLITASPINI